MTPFFAVKAAWSNALSSWPWLTPFSTPPVAFEAASVEYFFAAAAQLVPPCTALLAAFACACDFVEDQLDVAPLGHARTARCFCCSSSGSARR